MATTATKQIDVAPSPAEGVPTIATTGPRPLYYRAKRLFDAALAAALIVVSAPLLVVIATAVALESRGGIFYRTARVGCNRRPHPHAPHGSTWELGEFELWKFRSMVDDADPSLHEAHIEAFVTGQIEPSEADGETYKLQRDPRVTRVGRILRRTSLDELPQLFNVLMGDMSLVGPRPLPPYEVELYEREHFARFAAVPGLTGLWQVSGRCALPFADMMRLDLEYVQRQSLLLDLKILLLTIPAVLSGRGAG